MKVVHIPSIQPNDRTRLRLLVGGLLSLLFPVLVIALYLSEFSRDHKLPIVNRFEILFFALFAIPAFLFIGRTLANRIASKFTNFFLLSSVMPFIAGALSVFLIWAGHIAGMKWVGLDAFKLETGLWYQQVHSSVGPTRELPFSMFAVGLFSSVVASIIVWPIRLLRYLRRPKSRVEPCA